jgi:hypothetical protein
MEPNYTHVAGPTTFGSRMVAVTPGSSDLPGGIAKAVVTLTDGDLTVVPADNADGETFEFVNVPAGYSPPCRVRRVTAATATVAAVYD